MGFDTKIVTKYFAWALDTAREARLSMLSDCPLFKGVSRRRLRKILIDLVEKKYKAGDTIFHERESGMAIYFILEGAVKIMKKLGSEDKTLCVLGPSCHFGELALIGHTSRFATAVAEKDTLLLIMYKSYFDDLVRSNNAAATKILLNVAAVLSDYIHHQPESDDKTAP